ncbi:SecDF P1 head subdomain-containing protein [Notoacmeibacter marinus]|uniref:SecDF P1 head subdomain-containing protein n=1 Tax=Notoacmeibacter marinus TaxID=1876515 RepID=UPI0013B06C06|nr:hypothetical protein [Notoacmeibacter marinus]
MPIEIRLVAQQSEGGTALPIQGSRETLVVEPATLLGPSDVLSVGDVEWTTEGTKRSPGVNVVLTPGGAEKYERISTDNVGRTLAIIVDGKIVMAPRILDPVRAQGFLLTTSTEAEARELARTLQKAIAPDRD